MHHVKFVAIHWNFTIMLSSIISANYFAIIYAADNSQLRYVMKKEAALLLCVIILHLLLLHITKSWPQSYISYFSHTVVFLGYTNSKVFA